MDKVFSEKIQSSSNPLSNFQSHRGRNMASLMGVPEKLFPAVITLFVIKNYFR